MWQSGGLPEHALRLVVLVVALSLVGGLRDERRGELAEDAPHHTKADLIRSRAFRLVVGTRR